MARIVNTSKVSANSIKTRTATGIKMKTVDTSGETALSRTTATTKARVVRLATEAVSATADISTRSVAQGDVGGGIRYVSAARSITRPAGILGRAGLSSASTLARGGSSLAMSAMVMKIVSRKAMENLKFLNDLSQYGRDKAIKNALKKFTDAEKRSTRILENLKKSGADPKKIQRAQKTLAQDTRKLMAATRRWTEMANKWEGGTGAIKRATEYNTNIGHMKTAKKSLRRGKKFDVQDRGTMKFFSKPRRQLRKADVNFLLGSERHVAKFNAITENTQKLDIANGLNRKELKTKIKNEKAFAKEEKKLANPLAKYTRKQAKKAGKAKRLQNRARKAPKRAVRKSVRGIKSFALSAPRTMVSSSMSLGGGGGDTYSGLQMFKRVLNPATGTSRASLRTVTDNASRVGNNIWRKKTGKSFKKWAVSKAWAVTKSGAGKGIKTTKKAARFVKNTNAGKYVIGEVGKVTRPVTQMAKAMTQQTYAYAKRTTRLGKAGVKLGEFGANVSKKMTEKTAQLSMKATMKTSQYLTMALQHAAAKAAVAIKATTAAIEAILGALAAGFTALVGAVGLPLIACVGLVIIGIGVASSLGTNSPGIFNSTETSASETGGGGGSTGITLGWTQSYLTSLSDTFYNNINNCRDASRYPDGYELKIYRNSSYTDYAGNNLNENFNELITELFIWSGYDISGNGTKSLSELQAHLTEMYNKTHGCRKVPAPNDYHKTSRYQDVYKLQDVTYTDYTTIIGKDENGDPIYDTVTVPQLVLQYNPDGTVMQEEISKKYQLIDAYISHDRSIFTADMSDTDKQYYDLFARDSEGLGIWAKSDGTGLGYDDYNDGFGGRTLSATQGKEKDGELKFDVYSSMTTNVLKQKIANLQSTLKYGTTETKLGAIASIAMSCSPRISSYADDPYPSTTLVESVADVYDFTVKMNSSAGKASKLDNVVGCDGPGYIWQIYAGDGMPKNTKDAYGDYKTYAEIETLAGNGGNFKYIDASSALPGDIVVVYYYGNISFMGILYKDKATKSATVNSNYVSAMNGSSVTRHIIRTGSDAAYSGYSYKYIRVNV